MQVDTSHDRLAEAQHFRTNGPCNSIAPRDNGQYHRLPRF
ncbi:hypothetical protein Rhow_004937 [Rhodococcus wratislaviensis]|uniref:Uncharacterized protein n=1 Tax=Rhodococcus wratislaviensis TaxID=44752 RepID=A0A402CCF5_RHOWR|nr:hypothetical protein Rhow_004937 [Rhodococcus wratislaviensis]